MTIKQSSAKAVTATTEDNYDINGYRLIFKLIRNWPKYSYLEFYERFTVPVNINRISKQQPLASVGASQSIPSNKTNPSNNGYEY
jgi:hypothetical protein